ncbi:MAG: hypothetical protein ACYCX2_11515 [Christensenellales bacterium]
MKRAILLLLAFLLGITCSACAGNTETAFSIYTKTMEQLQTAKGIDMEMTADIKAGFSGVSLDITANGRLMTVKKSDTDMDMLLEADVSVPFAGNKKLNLYYTGGYSYSDIDGIKTKARTPYSAMKTDNPMAGLSADVIKSSSVSKFLGFTIARMVIDGEKLTDYITGMLSLYPQKTASAQINLQVDDIGIELMVNNQYQPIVLKASFKQP